jgi:hypothetical protein
MLGRNLFQLIRLGIRHCDQSARFRIRGQNEAAALMNGALRGGPLKPRNPSIRKDRGPDLTVCGVIRPARRPGGENWNST